MKKRNNRNLWIILTLIILVAFYFVFKFGMDGIGKDSFEEKIVIIPIKGVITADGQSSMFGVSKGAYSTNIVAQIEKASRDTMTKAIIFEINSPGGGAVASKEIGDAISKLNKPKIAWIREVGASGGYWVASECDYIVASPLSITGSIGVISSYLEFSGLMEEYGVKYEPITSGEYKDMGSPFKELKQNERNLLQSKINRIYDYFVDVVAKNRNIPYTEVKKMATGEFYLGEEAMELGLIDMMGGKEEAISKAKELADVKKIKVVKYEDKKSIFEVIGSLNHEAFYSMGQGIGSELKVEDEFKINL